MKLSDVESKMKKTIEATQQSFNSLRTGRANSAVLDRVTVEYYGMETPLKSLANISTPDATTILVQPYDKGSLEQIEKAISMSDVGLTPNNDGEVVRLNIPPLTSERRQELVKLASKYAEEGRVSIRNIRRDAIEEVRKKEKNNDLSEDESRDIQDKIQKLTDKYVSKVDELLKAKEEDITTV
ncbi:ribosome recycling factor [Euhalothece natronophila Z-M001]|uniref:Ribosome-recycling factor n=1 Tax=Euhalothece natronophila Z-M001 TaxID=522448 RepID=A0A5B8NM40_9CHRO|nr:ribosome recycling factor [Euhalothece natronophila]QDZ39149.1 ribosome recycling factor [Euhalothece natronophila Z-M001]